MEVKDFKLGDIVCLNSSSPSMTVTGIDGEYLVLTYWNYQLFKYEKLNTIASSVFKPAKK